MTKAESQQAHRINIESRVVASNTERSRQGLWAGVFVSVVFVLAACYFAYLGHPVEGATLIGATLVGLVTVFVTGKSQQKDELKEKAKSVPESKDLPDGPRKDRAGIAPKAENRDVPPK